MTSKRQGKKTKPICVVIDSNVLRSSLLLRTPTGAALIYFVQQNNGYIGLPEVIEAEVIKQIARAGYEAVDSIDKNFRTIEVLTGSRPDISFPSQDEFENGVRDRFLELQGLIRKMPFTLKQARSALEKVNLELPPNGPKNQQFKDSLIWETIIELARLYNVHFITNDNAFYKDREPKKGLAVNLVEEIKKSRGQVQGYTDIPSCLRLLQIGVPPLDPEPIASAINQIIRDELQVSASKRDFQLDRQVNYNIQAFLTERVNILAIEFRLTYNLSDISTNPDDIRNESTLTVTGECEYDTSKKIISGIRKDAEEFIWIDENDERGQNRNVFLYANAVIGGMQQIPYKFREPLPK